MASNTSNPFVAPKADTTPSRSDYSGIGRLLYLGLVTVIGLAFLVGLMILCNDGEPPVGALCCFTAVISSAMMAATSERLVNMGCSRWWSLGALIPVLNVFVCGPCLVCPTGFRNNRRLDPLGTIGLGVLCFLGSPIVLFMLFVLLLFLFPDESLIHSSN